MRKIVLFTLLLLGGVDLHAASQLVVVSMKTCHELHAPKDPFILVLYEGEPILASIRECMERANIPSASISGIGAIKDPVVSDYRLDRQDYVDRPFPGVHEVLSLNGTTSISEKGNVVAHVQVVFTDTNFRALGGHLTNGTAGIVVELTIIPFPKPIERVYDKNTGLELMDGGK